MKSIIGKKVGMTQVFDESGKQIPVTVIEAGPCVITQKKTVEKDGYSAIQLGFADQKEQRMTKPMAGHFKKAGVTCKKVLREVRVEGESELEVGQQIDVALFEDVNFVDVVGTTKGRGFQGVIKRHNFAQGRMSHGGHSKRRPGSIGMCISPARVFKGKKMPGQMGATRVTTQNLKVIAVRPEDNVLLVRGAVPGANGGVVMISKAIKKA